MARKSPLDEYAIKFLKDHYSTNKNNEIAAHISFMMNADGCSKDISVNTIQYYAKKLGLKKLSKHKKETSKTNRTKIPSYDVENFDFYCGSPTEEVRSVAKENKEKLVVCGSRKQMRDIRNATYRYNSHEAAQSGVRIKFLLDTARLSVVLTPETISPQLCSCRTHSFQEAGLCAPP